MAVSSPFMKIASAGIFTPRKLIQTEAKCGEKKEYCSAAAIAVSIVSSSFTLLVMAQEERSLLGQRLLQARNLEQHPYFILPSWIQVDACSGRRILSALTIMGRILIFVPLVVTFIAILLGLFGTSSINGESVFAGSTMIFFCGAATLIYVAVKRFWQGLRGEK
jgi:hypothetical protein